MKVELLIISMLVILFLVWIYFYIKVSKRKKDEKYLAEKQEAQYKYFQDLKEKTNKQKKVIYYKLNTHAIKLSLYPNSYFKNYNMEELYQKIIVKSYWLNEPFHSEFSKILQLIGSNNLWINDSESREIIMNIRDNKDIIKKQISTNVLDLSEVLNDVISKIYLILKNKKLFNKSEIQNSILAASIYVLSGSGEIDYICKSLGINYPNQDNLYFTLVDKIYTSLTQNSKQIVVQNYFVNSSFFKKIYNEIIFNSYKYPYTYSIDGSKESTIRLLEHVPKKQLLSIT